ncbi:MAG: hydantoinase B/oxoprolinase family protein [Terriglobales bacterium]
MPPSPDAVRLAIYQHLFHSIAEEMGAALRRSAFSPNIKERRDYSCAVFDHAGAVIAMGDHMPVHLGSMPMSVAAALAALRFEPGDVALLNDPFAGGTHLPDITLVMPVFIAPLRVPAFFVAARAHHADVGGTFPGSMGNASEIYQEGIRLPPIKLVAGGALVRDMMALLLANVRTPAEREGDLTAQIGACRTGATRLAALVQRYGLREIRAYMRHLNDYAARMVSHTLDQIPPGEYSAEDFLESENGDDIRIAVRITMRPRGRHSRAGHARVTVDFAGSAPQMSGSLNAVRAITFSAVYYVMRCLVTEEIAACAGLMRDVEVRTPAGSVVDARPPAAVAGGNVETSQRIVDVLMRALAPALPARIPAASSGTMNNLSFGGVDGRRVPFTYYETMAGGMGARPGANGVSGVHTHMTNSLNTPIEVLESYYPVRVRTYSLRPGSGGEGRFSGGEGLVRELEALTPVVLSLITERRKRGPWGLAGGAAGQPGMNFVQPRDAPRRLLPAKCTLPLAAGDRIRIESPGGGGWGEREVREEGRTGVREEEKQGRGRGESRGSRGHE